jgi:hypothetical protein
MSMDQLQSSSYLTSQEKGLLSILNSGYQNAVLIRDVTHQLEF